MKKVFVLLISVIIFIPFAGLAQDGGTSRVKWYSIEEAEKLNKQQPRKIMIDVYTDWCGWCKKMDKETFNHPVIAAYINEHYYPVKLNAESKEDIVFNGTTYKYVAQGARGYHELAAGLLNGQMSYPSVAYMNEKMELLGAVPGYMNAQSIEPLLNYIVEDKYTSESLEEYQKNFQSNIAAD
ncbi:MAG: thioredoxin [Bacteroides sp. SM23_62]|nr:MAG: thioredoxin [Bacteroides sp. SM23_62]